MIKVLVTGSNGQLGKSFKAVSINFPEIKFYFFDHEQCDITNFKSLMRPNAGLAVSYL